MSLNTVPFNPFPPSSDQQGSGGGSYVLPAATAETLGGIKVGDNLTVEEDGTLNVTLPIAADDTLGGVKVGSGLSINSETGVLSADSQIVDYSTTEQATGQKWIDRRDIYFKCVDIGALPNNSYKDVQAGTSNVRDICKIEGISTNGTLYVAIPHGANTASYGVELSFDKQNNTVRVSTSEDQSSYSGTVVLYYTKTETEE